MLYTSVCQGKLAIEASALLPVDIGAIQPPPWIIKKFLNIFFVSVVSLIPIYPKTAV